VLTLVARAHTYLDNIAISTPIGSFTYQTLLAQSAQVATRLLQIGASHPQAGNDLHEQRVAFLVPPGFDYVALQWGIWRAGGIAVPLCVVHPLPELTYSVNQSGATILIAHPDFADRLQPLNDPEQRPLLLTTDDLLLATPPNGETLPLVHPDLPDLEPTRRALMLYTSGTTGKPKGVVLTHANIEAQAMSLVEAWGWVSCDRILHTLPLHHIHGIINVLTCALWVGAECHILPKFDAHRVWENLHQCTLYMAVPTIYAKLISVWQQADAATQNRWSASCKHLRLMVSGSAALPIQVLETWQAISGHFLLERYGMTEIGMALSNPLHDVRRAGSIGLPLPGVEVRLVTETGDPCPSPDTPGEIQVKGPGVFLEYWQNPAATAKAFQSGWFCTGDLAICEDNRYRILGRLSVDIIKTGGYKVSALEIEEVIRTHPAIQDCAVVGTQDPEWGERVCAALVLNPAHQTTDPLNLDRFRTWAKAHLAAYKIPTRIAIVETLPRNAMGKVLKPAVGELFIGNL
jgi:malonyl-CoA/methylmalonyl-CoA synthetase